MDNLYYPLSSKPSQSQENIYRQAKELISPDTTVIRLGTSPLLNSNIISLLVTSYKEKPEKCEIILIEENFEILEQKLNNQELDIILIPTISKSSNTNTKTLELYQEELYLVDNTQTSDQNVQHQSIQLNDIRDKTFVMVPDTCGLSNITRSLLRSVTSEAKEYQGKALSYQVLADWAANGLGSAILPKSKIASHHSKVQIFKAKTAVMISFEAKWLKQSNIEIDHLIKHFKLNKEQIIKKGLN